MYIYVGSGSHGAVQSGLCLLFVCQQLDYTQLLQVSRGAMPPPAAVPTTSQQQTLSAGQPPGVPTPPHRLLQPEGARSMGVADTEQDAAATTGEVTSSAARPLSRLSGGPRLKGGIPLPRQEGGRASGGPQPVPPAPPAAAAAVSQQMAAEDAVPSSAVPVAAGAPYVDTAGPSQQTGLPPTAQGMAPLLVQKPSLTKIRVKPMSRPPAAPSPAPAAPAPHQQHLVQQQQQQERPPTVQVPLAATQPAPPPAVTGHKLSKKAAKQKAVQERQQQAAAIAAEIAAMLTAPGTTNTTEVLATTAPAAAATVAMAPHAVSPAASPAFLVETLGISPTAAAIAAEVAAQVQTSSKRSVSPAPVQRPASANRLQHTAAPAPAPAAVEAATVQAPPHSRATPPTSIAPPADDRGVSHAAADARLEAAAAASGAASAPAARPHAAKTAARLPGAGRGRGGRGAKRSAAAAGLVADAASPVGSPSARITWARSSTGDGAVPSAVDSHAADPVQQQQEAPAMQEHLKPVVVASDQLKTVRGVPAGAGLPSTAPTASSGADDVAAGTADVKPTRAIKSLNIKLGGTSLGRTSLPQAMSQQLQVVGDSRAAAPPAPAPTAAAAAAPAVKVRTASFFGPGGVKVRLPSKAGVSTTAAAQPPPLPSLPEEQQQQQPLPDSLEAQQQLPVRHAATQQQGATEPQAQPPLPRTRSHPVHSSQAHHQQQQQHTPSGGRGGQVGRERAAVVYKWHCMMMYMRMACHSVVK